MGIGEEVFLPWGTLILLIYYIFYDSRRIGIMKMHGLSSIHIWFIIAGRLVTVIFVLSAAVSLLVALLIKDTTSQFVGSTIISLFKTYVIVTVISLISYIYISRIKVSDAIKNRKDTNGIFVLNTLLKTGCSILLVLISLSIFSQYAEIRAKQENLKSWEQSKDYGVFYPVNVGYDVEDIQHGSPKTTAAEAIELYPVLNRMGAVFIEAHMYDEMSLIFNKDWEGIRSVKVNPNYLREFPVYFAHNQPVQVTEDTSDWILLVPEKYSNRENEIMSYFHKERADAYEFEEHFFRRAVPDSVKNQQSFLYSPAKAIRISFRHIPGYGLIVPYRPFPSHYDLLFAQNFVPKVSRQRLFSNYINVPLKGVF